MDSNAISSIDSKEKSIPDSKNVGTEEGEVLVMVVLLDNLR